MPPPWDKYRGDREKQYLSNLGYPRMEGLSDIYHAQYLMAPDYTTYTFDITVEVGHRLAKCKDITEVFRELHQLLPDNLRGVAMLDTVEYRREFDGSRMYATLKPCAAGAAPYLLQTPVRPELDTALNPVMQMFVDEYTKALTHKLAETLFGQAPPINTDSPVEPSTTEEDSDMGFGKKGQKYPDSIKDLDFSTLHTSQMWVLADFVGVRRQLASYKNSEEQRKALKTACLDQVNLTQAQYGYDIIVLQKKPKDAERLDKDSETHYVELLCDILNKYSEKLDAAGKASLTKIIDGMKAQVDGLKSTLTDYAKQAVREAADKRAPITIKERNTTRKVKGILPPEFKQMIELASARIPIMLVGPAGCGKTYLCEKLSEALDLEYDDQSCSEGMSESVFNGLLLPIGAGGEFKHVPSPFMDRYETGGVMLLDEIDAGDPNLFTYINKAVANKSYTVAQRYKKPRIEKHADFVLVAAANTYGNGADAMYVGRNQLDAATLDRFKVGLITMDYNREVEESLAPTEVCKWAWNIREKIATNKLRRIMSTRIIENIGRMVEQYKWDVNQWNRTYFTGWTEAERKLVGVA